MKTRIVSARIPTDLYQKVKNLALSNGVTLSDIHIAALLTYVDKAETSAETKQVIDTVMKEMQTKARNND